jgi:hypothetical protein
LWLTISLNSEALGFNRFADHRMIDGVYTGPVKEGVRHGQGRIDWDNGDHYVGNFENGLRSGHGVMTEPKRKRRYEGNWKMSQRHGHGTQSFGNGDHYIGDFANDKFHGRGELLTSNGKYEGEFRDGLRHGFGIMAFKHSCRYEGQWSNGRMDGKGLYIWSDSTRYEGQWVKGERTGEGVLTLPTGEKYGKYSRGRHNRRLRTANFRLLLNRWNLFTKQEAWLWLVAIYEWKGSSW